MLDVPVSAVLRCQKANDLLGKYNAHNNMKIENAQLSGEYAQFVEFAVFLVLTI